MISMWHTNAKLQSIMKIFTVKKLMVMVVLMLIYVIKETLQYECKSTSSTELYLIGYESPLTLSSIKKIIEGPISGSFYYLFQGSDSSNVEMTTICKLLHY